jgi:hypothetical protein
VAGAADIIDYDTLDSLLKPFEGQYFKLGQGSFVMGEDRCCAGLLQMIQHCQKSKYQFVILPVGEAAVSLSPAYQDLERWLSKRKNDVG